MPRRPGGIGDVLKAPVKTGMEYEVSLRVIEVEDKSSTEQGVAIRSGPELCLDDQ
jgi:hypothetical protein